MGRIADALARAEQRRGTTPARGLASVPFSTEKWAGWYGAADPSADPGDTGDNSNATRTVPIDNLAEDVVCYHDRSSLVSEQFRSLRTRLFSDNPHQEHRVYAISSAVPKEGKSVTTLNLGFSFSEIRHLKILLVDGDFRHSSLDTMLGVDSEPGLADLLQDRADYDQVVRRTSVPNLYFVSAGKTHGRSAPELLSTRAACATFKRFEREFHYAFVDTPPAATVADVGIIGQMTCGVIYVIRMNRTPEPLARRAVKLLANNNIPIVGGLLIGENDPSGAYGKQYSYHRYYREEQQ